MTEGPVMEEENEERTGRAGRGGPTGSCLHCATYLLPTYLPIPAYLFTVPCVSWRTTKET